MQRQTDFPTLLGLAQEYISAHYSAALTDPDKKERLRAYAEQFIRDGEWTVPGMSSETAADMLFREMAEYSILTPYLGSPGLEEINVNGWDDIALTYAGGRVEKLREHFYSPRHALDVIKRLSAPPARCAPFSTLSHPAGDALRTGCSGISSSR